MLALKMDLVKRVWLVGRPTLQGYSWKINVKCLARIGRDRVKTIHNIPRVKQWLAQGEGRVMKSECQ